MNNIRLAVDMDGVLCDWDYQTKTLTGKTADELQNEGGDDKMWVEIAKHGESFWSDMPWMKDGKELWNFVSKFPDVFLLSAPAKAIPESKTGKIVWINRELGNVRHILCQAVEKQNYAAKDTVLIDDMKRNIDQWIAKGGIGILHKSASETIQALKDILKG